MTLKSLSQFEALCVIYLIIHRGEMKRKQEKGETAWIKVLAVVHGQPESCGKKSVHMGFKFYFSERTCIWPG